ncbi:MAG TPA: hypothetical protein VK578_17800 [Edaphobacter sp.]|jgi:hypothetical protein|nr:hypothetical protein [Edaphobacter sp.]
MKKLLKFSKKPAATLLLFLCAVITTAWAQQRMVAVPAGTRLLVRMVDSIDAGRSRAGTLFTARLQGNLVVQNMTVAPDGAMVHGRIVQSSSAGRVAGRSELQLQLSDIMVNGTAFPVLSSDYSVQGSNALGSTARRGLGGAGLGAAIGAISGNAGRGAAIGGIGGGASSLISRGEQINIPSGTLLEFRLQQPASLPRP